MIAHGQSLQKLGAYFRFSVLCLLTSCDCQFSGHFQVHFPVLQKVLNKLAEQASGPWTRDFICRFFHWVLFHIWPLCKLDIFTPGLQTMMFISVFGFLIIWTDSRNVISCSKINDTNKFKHLSITLIQFTFVWWFSSFAWIKLYFAELVIMFDDIFPNVGLKDNALIFSVCNC